MGTRVSRKRFHRRYAWNPMFRPSRESLLRQNAEIDRAELPRIQDDEELRGLEGQRGAGADRGHRARAFSIPGLIRIAAIAAPGRATS